MNSEGRDSAGRGRASLRVPDAGRAMRTVLAGVTAALVLGLGVTLVPARPPAAPPSFSEAARITALDDALSLLAEASALAEAPAAGNQAVAAAEMLALQARALLRPAVGPSAAPAATSLSPGPTPAAVSGDVAGFVQRLTASAGRRLADAAEADGGIARLLASAGTAQYLRATDLAAVAGIPVPEIPITSIADTAPASGAACEQDGRGHLQISAETVQTTDLAGALAAVGRAEAEAVYVYQVAQTRLDPQGAGTAAAMLATHQDNVRRIEELSVENCAPAPPREAGYRLPHTFVAQPAASLGQLESGLLGVYGDLIALGSDASRAWAIQELVSSARRAHAWGAGTGAFPGLPVNEADLPELPPIS